MIISILLINIYIIKGQDKILEMLKANYTKAAKDLSNYNDTYKDPVIRAKLYYSNFPLKKYVVLFPNESYFLIRIFIDPCKNFKEKCCQNKASCLEDNTDIVSGNDLEVAWIVNNFLPICENEFDNSDCGTFLEVHLPGDERVLVEEKINNYYVNGFQTNFIKTTNLCAGNHEVS